MSRSMDTLRFVLMPVVALFAWFFVAATGIYFRSQILPIFCPAGSGSGKDYYAPYWPDLQFIVELTFVGLSAIMVVTVVILLAPVRKFRAGIFAYLIGASVATALALNTDWWLWLSAIASGLLPLLWLQHSDARRQSA